MNILIQNDVEQVLETTVYDTQIVNGGDINEAFLLKTRKGNFFLKANTVDYADHMFATEAKGLKLLADSNEIRTPKVISQRSIDNQAYLLLEYIPSGIKSKTFWCEFGNALAQLHLHSSTSFGLEHSNYIGRLAQSNQSHLDWPTFYIQERLLPQIKLADQNNLIDSKTRNDFDLLFKKLNEICPDESPALIHGDLWNGNFLVDESGSPVLIDPSVSYSHREMDIAMSRLFGGFGVEFYQTYNDTYALAPGLEDRLDIYQLYYLMVHVNLFGGSYLNSVQRILSKYT